VKKKTRKNKIETFLKSQAMVSLVLSILVVILLIFNSSIIKNEKIYVVEGNNKDIVLKTGSISINNRIIFFNGPSIKYKGKDITLKNYKMGYYVNNKKIYEIANDDTKATFSLKTVLENYNFNFLDSKKNSNIYTKKVIKNIEKMKFKLTGTKEDGKKVSITIPLEISEI